MKSFLFLVPRQAAVTPCWLLRGVVLVFVTSWLGVTARINGKRRQSREWGMGHLGTLFTVVRALRASEACMAKVGL